jgi:protein TonB
MTASSPYISPIAVATSALLHAMIALALMPAALPQQVRMTERLVEVTLDLPSPPIEAPALAGATDQAALNLPAGSDEVQQSTLKQDEPQPAAVRTPVPVEPDVALIVPSSEPPPTPASRNFGNSASPPAPEPNWQKILPPLQAPSPITGQDFARSAPPATPSSPNVQPQTRAPAPQQPIREARPRRASQQQAAAEETEGKAQDTPSPLTRAATDYSHRQAQQDYLWHMIRKLSQYHFYGNSRDESERGLVVARLTVARDGRLLDAAVAKSSGFPGLDRAVIDTVRRASPFPPLPADLAADSYTFIVPINYTQQR